MSTVNSTIIGAAEREFQKQTAVGSSELDKMAFLKLLVAQLQHQDPLNPMDDTAFVSQLAQFTQLETLNNISGSMDTVIEGMSRQENLAAANFLGKYIESYGDQVSVDSTGSRTELYYYLNEDVSGGQVNIMNSSGEIIRTMTMGAKTSGGPYPLGWDGCDYQGNKVPEGVYLVGMSAVNPEGTAVLIASQVSGKVDRVFYEEGTQYLGLEDGRVVNLSYVTAIREPMASDTAETTEQKITRLTKEITDMETKIAELDQIIAAKQAIIDDAASTTEEITAAQTAKALAEEQRLVAKTEKERLEAEKAKLVN